MSSMVALLCWTLLPLVAAAGHNSSDPTPQSGCGWDCVRCAPEGCMRCGGVLVSSSRACAESCPAGTHEAIARDDALLGRVCYPNHFHNEAVIGGCAGAAACVVLAACGAACARCRPRRAPRPRPLPLPQTPPADPRERASLSQFHKQLDCLRPHAYTLLSILNNTRRQVRELYLTGNSDAAMAYSCVLSDLSKLLLLLNKSEVPVVPDEWPRLASWAERILKRYNRMTMTSTASNPVTQLVDFLKPPEQEPRQFTTFKPPSYASSSLSEELFDKEFDFHWNDELRPPSYSLIERESIPLADPWERRPIVRRESIWIEDEELKLARPQDELTTEL